MGIGGRDRDEDRETSARDAALYDPDSVFHDHAAQTTAGRAVEAMSAPDEEPAAPEPAQAENLYPRSKKGRTGALTKEMIKRIADRAERAAEKKK